MCSYTIKTLIITAIPSDQNIFDCYKVILGCFFLVKSQENSKYNDKLKFEKRDSYSII